MSRRSEPRPDLPQRHWEILKDVIHTYIVSGEPVSSRAVAKLGRLGLSPASIRNAMADLEEWGYLAQPHTSAGRVPTAAGYHRYIESMIEGRKLPARERRYIEGHLTEVGSDADRIVGAATHLLSELSRQVGIVVTPALGETVLKSVEFVPLSGGKVLCVVVSTSGFVDNRVIAAPEPISRHELIRLSNYLTENFAGLTLREARDRLLKSMAEESDEMGRLLAETLELASAALEIEEDREIVVEGTTALLVRPELADVDRVRRLFETFNDKARLVQILNQCMEGGGVRVLIGEDSDLTSELDFSLVATAYGAGDQVLGSLGIFGPSRMEYAHVIPLVSFLGQALSQRLASQFDS